MDYNTIIEGISAGEITVKKSRFIAAVSPAASEEDAEAFIKQKKKEYHDARHNCSCYIIGKGDTEKSSDDGEPSGTAGRPMLEVLQGRGIYNVVCVVTRYFGGVLLGTGGLVRAYQDAVKEALINAELLSTFTASIIEVTSDYNNWGAIENLCRSQSLGVSDINYTESVAAKIEIPIDNTTDVIKKITDISNGKAIIVKKGIKEIARKLNGN